MREFTLQGRICKVVPEEDVGEVLEPSQPAADRQLHVIGGCVLQGHRYLVLTERVDDMPEEAENRPAVDLLTRREMQVALMVSQGRCNKQIAHHLHLSEWTVSSYIRRIYAKFGVRSRAAMVAKLLAACGMEGIPEQ